jgi:hypothetical protein
MVLFLNKLQGCIPRMDLKKSYVTRYHEASVMRTAVLQFMLGLFGDKRSDDSGRRAQDSGAAALGALEELRRECEQPGPELVEQAGQCSQCREELLGIRGKVRFVFVSGEDSVVVLRIV